MPAVPNVEGTPQRVAAIDSQLADLERYLDPEGLTRTAAELEGRMGAPGVWDDQETAAKVSAEHARTTRKLETWQALQRDAGDLEALLELADEDDSLADEVGETLADIEGRLATLEEQRLFAGPYDAGDALVTVNAGAGGTDAQDWAEMVLRMLMRWSERRGFTVELLEVSPGEEAGIKSATFRAEGENAYGLFGAERGVHRLVRLSPFDSANRRQTSFAGVEVARARRKVEVGHAQANAHLGTRVGCRHAGGQRYRSGGRASGQVLLQRAGADLFRPACLHHGPQQCIWLLPRRCLVHDPVAQFGGDTMVHFEISLPCLSDQLWGSRRNTSRSGAETEGAKR